MSFSVNGSSNRSQQIADQNTDAQSKTASGAADKIGQLGTGLASQASSAVGGLAGKGGASDATSAASTPSPTASSTPVS